MKIYVNKNNKGKGIQHFNYISKCVVSECCDGYNNVMNKTSYTHSNAGFEILTL